MFLAVPSPTKADASRTHINQLFPLFVALTPGQVWQKAAAEELQRYMKTTSGAAPLRTQQVIHQRQLMDHIKEDCFYKHPSNKNLIYF